MSIGVNLTKICLTQAISTLQLVVVAFDHLQMMNPQSGE